MELLPVVLLSITILSTVSALPVPNNHIIRFEGFKNGYNDITRATQELQSNLNRITGRQDIIIDSLDESSATWHSDEINKLSGDCPEAQIRELFASIKKEGDFTRIFKMEMDENFTPPSLASIEWLGACENVARKRSQVDGDVTPTTTQPTTLPVTTKGVVPTTTKEPATATTPEPSTTTTAATTSTVASLELIDFTTEIAPLMSEPVMSTTETVAATTTTTTTATPELPVTTAASEQPSTTTTPESPATTTTPESPASTTTTEPPLTTSTTEPPAKIIATEESTTTSTTEAPTTTTATELSELSETTTTTATTETPPTSGSSSLVDAGPQYGKYIGLCTGFLFIVIYLLCCRATKQGIYTLHNE